MLAVAPERKTVPERRVQLAPQRVQYEIWTMRHRENGNAKEV
jgi:hypothetical protein